MKLRSASLLKTPALKTPRVGDAVDSGKSSYGNAVAGRYGVDRRDVSLF
jgi:hypothetical protein